MRLKLIPPIWGMIEPYDSLTIHPLKPKAIFSPKLKIA